MASFFGFTGDRDTRLLELMDRTLQHRGRGPRQEVWTRGAGFGFRRRLAEPAPAPHDTGLYTEGDLILGVAGTLRALDDRPRPSLAHLIEAYTQNGSAGLHGLRGDFVLALWDGRTLHLMRDGAGARTLYFCRHLGRVFFAVEPKGLWSLPGFSRNIRPEALARYLSFSFQPGEQTMLEGIFELASGTLYSFEGSDPPQRTRYFNFEAFEPEQPDPRPDAYWITRFRQILAEAVADRLPAGGEVGAFLSGGIDSSVVVAELARQAPGRVSTWAVHFGKDYPNELEHARAVAQRCGTRHHELCIRPKDFLRQFREIIWRMDDPIGDPVTMPNYCLAQIVGRQLDAVFNGEGGDPLFGGPKNLTMMLHHWYGGLERGPYYLERAYLSAYRRAYDVLPLLLTPDWQTYPQASLEGVLTPFFETEKPRLFLNKLMAINIRLKGSHLILPKVERMLAAHGMIPLSPLFDERLIALSFAMPTHLKMARGLEKIALKQAYANDLPQEILDRPKSGMRVPVHFWFQGELRRYARKLLSKRRLKRAGIFNPEKVKQLLDYDLEEGRGRYGIRLWMLLTFEIWRTMVMEDE